MNKEPLSCVVFDVDGTLVDSAAIVVEAVFAACKENQLPLPKREMIVTGIGLSLDDAIRRLFPEAENQIITKLATDYRAVANELRLKKPSPMFDGAMDCLCQLEQKGVLLAVATGNSRIGVERVLRPLGIYDKFISVKTADFCAGKPNPQMLDEIMQETGVRAENLFMVGDSIYDMLMAKNAKTKAVGVNWGYHTVADLQESGADFVVNDFKMIISLLS